MAAGPIALAAAVWGSSRIAVALGLASSWWTMLALIAASAEVVCAGALLFPPQCRSPIQQARSAWRENREGIRQICDAFLLSASVSMLMFLSAGAAGRTSAWLYVLAVQSLAVGLFAAISRLPGPWLWLVRAAAGAEFVATAAVAAFPHSPVTTVVEPVLGAAGWTVLIVAVSRIAALPSPGRPAARADQPGATEQAGPAGQAGRDTSATFTSADADHAPDSRHRRAGRGHKLITSAVLGVSTAASLLVTMSGRTRIAIAPVALLLISLAAFCLHEVVRSRQQSELVSRLASLAATDPLTGLGNRRALAAAMAGLYRRGGEDLSVLTIDLDNFKMINTLLGHQAGDRLLIEVARSITTACSAYSAQAFRLGGDEFAVMVEGTPGQASQLAHGLIEQINGVAATVPGASRVDVSASIGIAHHCPDPPAQRGDPAGQRLPPDRTGGSDSGLDQGLGDLTRSGHAMRAAKAAGRAQVLAYSADMAKDQTRHDRLERQLRRAIASDEVRLHLQPIISLPEMRMVGMESLARWTDQEFGPVSPVEFIAIAEDSGLIVELGLQLARRSMELSLSTGAHAAGLVGGVNVSPAQLRSPTFVSGMASLLAETGVRPEQFVLEVTESIRIEEDDPALAAIWKLSETGMPVAIDDFGTGYASLTLISTLPAKILKLDRSITQKLHDQRGMAIARCVTDMARALEIDVVAEGVETAEHLQLVRGLGVGFGQGWLFERAVPPEQFSQFVCDPDLVLRHLPSTLLQPAPG